LQNKEGFSLENFDTDEEEKKGRFGEKLQNSLAKAERVWPLHGR